ncbi:hypothetical protein AVEN_212459-1 [Araneus ventricosus]|uniref:Uncharacterized protein n=1 Tax=Araneus ventricosus TaxID=182803 RepID=A0A4Y2JDZ0_ARAVE|nr:hypothetical protein AVEN_212459-1 [Araneus ventricosus]
MFDFAPFECPPPFSYATVLESCLPARCEHDIVTGSVYVKKSLKCIFTLLHTYEHGKSLLSNVSLMVGKRVYKVSMGRQIVPGSPTFATIDDPATESGQWVGT